MNSYTRVCVLVFIQLFIILDVSSSCGVNLEDSAIIKRIVEDHITNDCITMLKLAGIFFENQQKPPNTVRVTYKLRFPYNSQCKTECSCWKDHCDSDDSDYCSIEKHYLWGRIPTYVQDSIFRELTMCNLIVGGVKEKAITISINITDNTTDHLTAVDSTSTGSQCMQSLSMPCSWCSNDTTILSGSVLPGLYILDTLFSLSAGPSSPLEKALMSVTAKLQGYAAKLEKVEWLIYNSELALGFSAPYQLQFDTVARWVMFLLYYTSFQIMIFMLVYKYRYRIYNNVCSYVSESRINNSLFWSFILTTILAFICVLVLSIVADGICMSVLQIIMIAEAMAFGIPHTLVSCFRMKKSQAKLVNREIQSFCLHRFVPSILFSYIYTLPHVAFYWAMNIIVSFVAKPFSYLVLFVYFCVSTMFIWIANAIGIHLLFPLMPSKSAHGYNCRRQFFAIVLLITCNCLNFITWGFIEVYFYDKRAQTTSLITVLPGITFTLLGYYLSGDLVKVFDMLVVTLPAPKPFISNDTLQNSSEDHSVNYTGSYHDDDGHVNEKGASHTDRNSILSEYSEGEYPKVTPRRTYKFSRLKRVVNIFQRPASVIAWNNTPSNKSYHEIPESNDTTRNAE